MECSMCSNDVVVELIGRAALGSDEEALKAGLCVDHYNMVKKKGKKWCPTCTNNVPIEMEFDGLVGDKEHWYCTRCDREYEYKRTDV